jgi:hypothetical protein
MSDNLRTITVTTGLADYYLESLRQLGLRAYRRRRWWYQWGATIDTSPSEIEPSS